MTDPIIETFDLTKIYPLKGKQKQIKALDNVNISIKKGEVFGLLGPNGAGKTTLIQILTTLLQPTSGYALIDGFHLLKNSNKVKSKVALMLESQMLYYRITAYDNLKFFCKIYNVPNYKAKILDMAKSFGIESWLDQYVESLSTGMKMKLALCRTLLLDRDILFLDEPTVGLDVKIISSFVDILKDVKNTIIFTSHDLSVVDKICDRIAFINEGKILKIGTKDELKLLSESELKIVVYIDESKQELISELSTASFITDVKQEREDVILILLKERRFYGDLLTLLGKYKIKKIREEETSLENMFLKIC